MKIIAALLLCCILMPAASLLAQPVTAPAGGSVTAADLAKLDQRVTAAQSSADNAWMLVSAALVLMMTGPGLALFYGGLVRQKNVLAMMMHSFAHDGASSRSCGRLSATASVSLRARRFIGGFGHMFLHGVGVDPDPDYARTIPHQTFMIYQLMFAIITPALITGAFAGAHEV